MADNWGIVSLEEIAASDGRRAFAMGPFGSNIKSENYQPNGVPVIRGVNLLPTGFSADDLVFLSEEKAADLQSSQAFPDDVVFVAQGTVGRVGVIPRKARFAKVVLSQNLMKFTCDRAKADPRFVYYFFTSREGQHEIRAHVNPTGVPCISRPLSSLKGFQIPLPPLTEQRAIANILGVLDDKIELNRRMNETLEGLARAIFQSWFVDFDPVRAQRDGLPPPALSPATAALFPDSFEDSLHGEIPAGWEALSLGELCERHDAEIRTGPFGTSLHADEYTQIGVPVIAVRDLNFGYLAIDERSPRIPDAVAERLSIFRVKEGDILFGRKGAVERSAYIGATEDGWLMGSDCIRLRLPNRLSPLVWSYGFRSPAHVAWMQQHATGTTMASLNQQILKAIPIVLPPENLLRRALDIFQPLNAKMECNRGQSQKLAAIRDALLPKLLSGEIRVGEAERLVEDAG